MASGILSLAVIMMSLGLITCSSDDKEHTIILNYKGKMKKRWGCTAR